MTLIQRITRHARSVLGLDWLEEAREIAEAARKQRLEDEQHAPSDPHDFGRWWQEPKGYRRPAPDGGRRHEAK